MSNTVPEEANQLIDERALSKLRWRSRRGLLENDLFIDRFFKKYSSTLTVKQAQGLSTLMALADSDLLDLHLGRKSLAQVDPELVRDDVSEVLSMLRATTKGPNEAS